MMCRDQDKQHKLCTGDCMGKCERTGASVGKWTPGPWVVYDQLICSKDMSTDIATCYSLDIDCNDEYYANTHLIAAAPELYEALQAALALIKANSMDDFAVEFDRHLYDQTVSALAKARGESDD